jgi:branched-chain amino acid transport system substrate-binding protein
MSVFNKRATAHAVCCLAAGMLLLPASAFADVRLVAILPLSGPYASSGELYKNGIELAVREINAAGGIKALNGEKITVDIKDTGTTVESAVATARQMLSGDKPAGGMGAWLSSFTLGVSELSERRHIPWLTISSSDHVSDRGFHYLYQTVAPSSSWAGTGLEYLQKVSEEKGCPIKKIAIVGDNTASPTAFFKAVREQVAPKLGWKLVMDTVWTPPLADATAIAQQMAGVKPDLVLFGASNFPDAAQVLSRGIEFGVKTNYVGNGSWLVMPEYLSAVGAKNLEGIFDISGAHPLKGFGAIEGKFKADYKQPFLQQEGLAGYYNVWIFKAALEKAASADPEAVNEALKTLDLDSGPAAGALPSGRVKFDENGRLADATPVIAQWQNGTPVSVFPENRAMAAPHFECVK